MNVGKSVRKSIDEWEQSDLDSAMLHACNAVDGTAKKEYPDWGSNRRFTTLLRKNYWVLGPMGVPGIDLRATRFPVKVQNPKAPGGQPDISDVIYGIHRCSHGHGEDLPDGFELLPDVSGPKGLTRMRVENGKLRLSDRIIFGLLAVAVLSPKNADQRLPDSYHLSFAENSLPINGWWGRGFDAKAVFETEKLPQVTLDFGDWMPGN